MTTDEKLETRRLRYFMEVLESGSIRGAAGALGMDASAVSRAVGSLEEECGTPLFERRGRGIAPTDAGQLLAVYLRRQKSEKQNLLAQIESIRKVESGHVDIMTGEGYVDWLMHECLCPFMQAHSRITVGLDIGSTDEIVQHVISERTHFGILFRPPKDERLHSHYSQPNPIKTWVLRTHPLAKLDRPLKLADLTPYAGAAVYRGFGLRQHIEAAEISEDVRLNVSLTAASFDAISHFVTAGLGYALAPQLAVAPADADKVVGLPMRNPLLYSGRSHVISRRGRTLPPAAIELLQIVLKRMRLPRNPVR